VRVKKRSEGRERERERERDESYGGTQSRKSRVSLPRRLAANDVIIIRDVAARNCAFVKPHGIMLALTVSI